MTAENWNAVSAIATAFAAIVSAVVMVLTFFLLRSTRDQVSHQRTASEAELMQRLMERYDALAENNEQLQGLWKQYKEKTPEIFHHALIGGTSPIAREMVALNESRHRVSRFFVSIRRLVHANRLPEDIVVAALEASAFQWFVEGIDPLDKVKAGERYEDVDRRFFLDLLARRYSVELTGGQVNAASESN